MKVTGAKAGELFNKQTAALKNARTRLLRLCAAQNYDFPSHALHYCGGAKRKVSGNTLVYDGRVYEILTTMQAQPGDEGGDPKLICFRVVQEETRNPSLFVFTAL